MLVRPGLISKVGLFSPGRFSSHESVISMKTYFTHYCRRFTWVVPVLATLICAAPAAFSAASTSDINGFSDPGGFTLNGNTGGYDGQDATAHGVPKVNGGTLHLTTSLGVPDAQYNTFFGSENTSIFANQRHYIGQFYSSFVYRYYGTNPLSFGPGNGFGFILHNDPRGLAALGTSGIGNGQLLDSGTIAPSATIEFGLFTGFGQPRGTQLAFDGDPGVTGIYRVPGTINLISGDPITVILTYNGATLTETLTDTVTHATYNTNYAADLPAALGDTSAYVGFCGGTGAAVADQTITNFVFSNNVPIGPPVNTGPKLSFSVVASTPTDTNGTRYFAITTTNSGGRYADQVEITGVTVNGIIPPASDIHNVLPTIKNLLTVGSSQTNTFVCSVTPGTTRALVTVAGDYIDPRTKGLGHFSGTLRVTLPPPSAN